MLILSRYQNETIHIGDDIVITISQIRGHRVRVGISAPESVKVLRGEIVERQQAHPLPPVMPSHIPPQVMGYAA